MKLWLKMLGVIILLLLALPAAAQHEGGLVPGFTLTDQESDDLVAFLLSLIDEQFVTDARLSDPFVNVER